ncbi:transposase InsO family protein [Auritidibacter ignavus]|nr:transposase InsO family protein [Auritidibacter ignavus]
MPRLCDIDQATGPPVRKPKPKRYEAAAPGELVHIDIKKQGRIPDSGGWRVHGRGSEGHHAAQRNKIQARKTVPVHGYRYRHHAVDDNCRAAYSEILDDQKKETAAGFWKRANAFFNDLGNTVKAVITDNGACYRSAAIAKALGEGVKHKRTKPYRPHTNGTVERFNKTLASESAYPRALHQRERTR